MGDKRTDDLTDPGYRPPCAEHGRIVQVAYRLEAVVGAQVAETREAMRQAADDMKNLGRSVSAGMESITRKLDALEIKQAEHRAWHNGTEHAGQRGAGKVSTWTAILGLVLAAALALGGAVWAVASGGGGMDERDLVRVVRAAMHDRAEPPAPSPSPGG